MPSINKIVIVGNAGAGKTTLSLRLSEIHGISVTHVDSVQFLAGMKIRPHGESIATLKKIEALSSWIIEGYGPFELIENRFQLADRIVFIDFSVWRHLWWSTKRQIKNAWSKREELPEGCDEFSFKQTAKLYRTILKMNEKMRPELLKIFARDDLKHKVIHVTSYSEWKKLFNRGITN
jgi:adenylate kinase family enzyme